MTKLFKLRLLTATLLALLCCMPASAQWHYGFKSGVMRTRATRSDYWDRNNKWGGTIGGVVKYDCNDWFALQGELNYALRGFKTDLFSDVDAKPHDWLFNFHYIDVPVLAKFYPAGLPFFIEAGPQVGFLAGFGENIKGAAVEPFSSLSDYRKWNAAVVFGLGVETDLGIFFDLRYNLGLNKIAANNAFRHRGWELTAGYLF